MKTLIVLFIAISVNANAALDTVSNSTNNLPLLLKPTKVEMKLKSIVKMEENKNDLMEINSKHLTFSKLSKVKNRLAIIPKKDSNMIGLEFYNYNEVFHLERFRTPVLRFKF